MPSFKEKLFGIYSMYTTIKLKKETKTRTTKVWRKKENEI